MSEELLANDNEFLFLKIVSKICEYFKCNFERSFNGSLLFSKKYEISQTDGLFKFDKNSMRFLHEQNTWDLHQQLRHNAK